MRKNLSSELGFSREHRDLNIQRIGFVAAEISKNGGAAICAPIAPYAQTRKQVRETVTRNGGFVEVHVSTPIEVCEERDRKGLYAKARAGLIKEFTGISALGRSTPAAQLRPAGLEPATYWFEASHSIQLSYGRRNLRLAATLLHGANRDYSTLGGGVQLCDDCSLRRQSPGSWSDHRQANDRKLPTNAARVKRVT